MSSIFRGFSLKAFPILLLVVSVFCGHSLFCQIQFEQVPPPPPAPQNIAEFDGVSDSAIAFEDVDLDGDLDVLITGYTGFGGAISKLYINDGIGNYQELIGTPFEPIEHGSLAFSDVDLDGDPDVVISGLINGFVESTKLYLNDGAGFFSEVLGVPFDGVSYSCTEFADVDSDGDPDLLIAGFNSSSEISKLYLNDGSGNFSEVIGTPFEAINSGSAAFSDIDGDSDQDLLLTGQTSFGRITKLYSNDGNGTFTEVIGTPFYAVSVSSVAFADVDFDNDPDLLITGETSTGRSSKLYVNDGAGNFSEQTSSSLEAVSEGDIAFADVDGDLDLDLLITGSASSGFISRLYSNDGNGIYSEVVSAQLDPVSHGSVAFSDIDGDLDSDLIIAGLSNYGFRTTLYVNNGNGEYDTVSGMPFDGVFASSVAFSDIDSDGDADVLISGSNYSGRSTKLYSNDGNGNYSEVIGTPFEAVAHGSIAFSDVDGDADQDILLIGSTSSGSIAKLYSNDGSGNFSEVIGTPFDGLWLGSVAFADVDLDNDPDLMITGSTTTGKISKLYLNDGVGNFSELFGTPFEEVSEGDISFVDFDDDGDLDVLITGENTINQRMAKLYANSGNGNFSEVSGTPFEGVSQSSIASTDIDLDGDTDILIAGNNGSGANVKLYLNNGNGNFTEETNSSFGQAYFGSIALADIDTDGDPDVLITGDTGFGITSSLYLNDGTGNFSEILAGFFAGVQLGSVAFEDIDGDNDSDLLITGEHDFTLPIAKLYRNTTNQVCPDSDGDGICDENDTCPNTPGQIGDPCNDGSLCTANDTIDSNCNCIGISIDCNDSDACTFDTCDPQVGCIFTAIDCDDGDPCTSDICDPALGCVHTPLPDTDGDGICDDQEVPGCTDASACNYNASATDNDGSCQYLDACGVCGGSGSVAGCTSESACNYDPSADCDDGSCIVPDLQIVWENTITGGGTEDANAVIATSDGGYLLGGITDSGPGFDKTEGLIGGEDHWVVKLDASGNIQWQNTIGGTNIETLTDLKETSDGYYLIAGRTLSSAGVDVTEGAIASDYWLVKMDASGNIIWDRTIGGDADDTMITVIETSDGNYLLGGYSKSGATGDKTQPTYGDWDYWLVKVDTAGNILWNRSYGGSDIDLLFAMNNASDGNLLVGGYSRSPVSGTKLSPGNGQYDYWIMKVNISNGAEMWQQTYGGSNNERLRFIEETSDGSIVIGGSSDSPVGGDRTAPHYGGEDFWVMKLDNTGNYIWDASAGGTASELLFDGTIGSGGKIVTFGRSVSNISGTKSEDSLGDSDYWMVMFDPNGGQIVDKIFGGTSRDVGQSIDINANGQYVLFGYSDSPAFTGYKAENSVGFDYWALLVEDANILGCTDATACNFNVNAICDDGTCVYASGCDFCSGETDGSGSVVDFDQDDDGICDDVDDCDTIAGMVGDSCDDGSACTENDVITSDCNCVGTPVNCDDGNPCTTDSCDPETGCVNAYNNNSCNDGNACTFNDTCVDGVCAGTPITCDDGDPCTIDTCDPAVGCIYTPKPDSDGDGICDDEEIPGCTDLSACNYNELATDDNGSCQYLDACGVCGGTGTVSGCTNENACNYDPAADCDDGSCIVGDLQIVWENTITGGGTDLAYTIESTSDGGYLVGVNSNSGAAFDKTEAQIGGSDYWVIKLDANGNIVWQNTIGGNEDDDLTQVIETSDGGYLLVGRSFSDAGFDVSESTEFADYWVVKLNSGGSVLWDKVIGGNGNDQLLRAIESSDGNYFLGGYSDSGESGDRTQPSFGDHDYWLIKMDTSGNILWDRAYGGSDVDYLFALNNASDGNVYVAGYSRSPVSGTKLDPGNGLFDFWVMKVDVSNGDEIWQSTIGASGNDRLRFIEEAPDGTIVAGGLSDSPTSGDKTAPHYGGEDYWIVKMDNSGNYLWDSSAGGSGDDFLFHGKLAAGGKVVAVGRSDSNASGNKTENSLGQRDFWMVQFKPDGTKLIDKVFGGTGDDQCHNIDINSNDQYILTGFSDSPSNAEYKSEDSVGQDVWVMLVEESTVFGCTDETACNYNINAVCEDGTCIYPVGCEDCSGETDGTGVVVDTDDDDDGICNDADPCPSNFGEVGDPCDDGNQYTENDVLQSDCSCLGDEFDTDGDGITDNEEVNIYGTDPLQDDTDGDGLTDGAEINQSGTNPLEEDTDGDGCSDLLEFGYLCPDSEPCGDPTCIGDLNNDGTINTGDLTALLGVFGNTCP